MSITGEDTETHTLAASYWASANNQLETTSKSGTDASATTHELAGTHEHVSGVSRVISILTAQHRKSQDCDHDAKASTVTAEELVAVFEPNAAAMDRLVEDFCTLSVKILGNDAMAGADAFDIRAALYARKGDVTRAVMLFKNHAEWRRRIGLTKGKGEAAATAGPLRTLSDHSSRGPGQLLTPSMREQLASGLIVSPGTRDRQGRATLFLRMRLAQPSRHTALETVRLAGYVMEWTLRAYPYALTHGLSFFQDMRGMGFRNMDLRVPGELRSAYTQKLPVRIASIQVLHPPVFMRAVFAVVGAMMSEKMKVRTKLINKADALAEVIDPSQMLDDCGLGGTMPWTDEQHTAWCRKVEHDLSQAFNDSSES